MDLTALGAFIRDQRGRHGWSQEEFARRIGKGQEWVSYVETGRRRKPLTSDEIDALSAALGVPRLELMRIAGYRVPPSPAPAVPAPFTLHTWIDRLDQVRDLPDEAKDGFRTLAAMLERHEREGR